MMRRFVPVVFIVLFLLSLLASQAGAVTDVDSCRTLNLSGVYELTDDLDGETFDCLIITSDDVILDCRGHEITNTDRRNSRAIHVSEVNNVTVKNCMITYSYDAVQIEESENVLIEDSDMFYCQNSVRAEGSSNIVVRNVNALHGRGSNVGGLSFGYVSNLLVENSVVENSTDDWWNPSFSLSNVENVLVRNSRINNNTMGVSLGMYAEDSYFRNVTFRNVDMSDNVVWDFIMFVLQPMSCHEGVHLDNVVGTGDQPIVFYDDTVELRDWDNNFSMIMLCDADNSKLVNMKSEEGWISMVLTDNAYLENIDLQSSKFAALGMGMSNLNIINGSRLKTKGEINTTYGIVSYWVESAPLVSHFSSWNTIKNSVLEGFDFTHHCLYMYNWGIFGPNMFYNNIFNCSPVYDYFYTQDSYHNYWNVSEAPGLNIAGGPHMGGNYYANGEGTGFSDMCGDADENGFCDVSYVIDSNNIDLLPLSSTFFAVPCNPIEMTESLKDYVYGMDIHHGTRNSLISKLRNVVKSLEKGNKNSAVNKLHAFMNHVEAQRGKKIPEGEASYLIESALDIIECINS